MKRKTRRAFLCFFSLFGILLFLEYRIPAFALFVDRLVGASLRTRLALVFSAVRFSIAEWLLLGLPILFLPFVLVAILCARSERGTRGLLCVLFSFLLAFFAVYVLAFAPGKHRTTLEDSLALSKSPPTGDEVLSCILWLSSLASSEIPYPGDEETEEALRKALSEAGKRYHFLANTEVAVKESTTALFLRMGYFGLYAFPFGEITLTSACPAATRTFTLAHEMAHASGFSREEEADVIALLSCLDSHDPYLISAAATGMLGRAMCALYENSPALWERASAILPDTARRELSEAGEVYEHGMTEAGVAVAEDYGAALRLLCAVYRARSGTE